MANFCEIEFSDLLQQAQLISCDFSDAVKDKNKSLNLVCHQSIVRENTEIDIVSSEIKAHNESVCFLTVGIHPTPSGFKLIYPIALSNISTSILNELALLLFNSLLLYFVDKKFKKNDTKHSILPKKKIESKYMAFSSFMEKISIHNFFGIHLRGKTNFASINFTQTPQERLDNSRLDKAMLSVLNNTKSTRINFVELDSDGDDAEINPEKPEKVLANTAIISFNSAIKIYLACKTLDHATQAMDDSCVFLFSIKRIPSERSERPCKTNFELSRDQFEHLIHSYFKTVRFFSQFNVKHEGISDCCPVAAGLDEDATTWIAECINPQKKLNISVSIIIPVYNKCSYTIKSLASIFNSTGKEYPFEVIVIDNASTDETQATVKEMFPSVVYLRNDYNAGFAKASNQGALVAKGNYLIFLNNDTEVKTGWVAALIDELRLNNDTGVVGARLLYPDGSIQHAGVAIDRSMTPIHIHRFLPGDDPLVLERREYPIVTAACAAVRRMEFYQIGMFDETYINGHEDVDLCLRYGSIGKKIIYRPDCVVIHHESISDGRMDHCLENKTRTMAKWYDFLIQNDFHYEHSESSRINHNKGLNFAIKIGPPDRTQLNWGDTYFAESLARQLERHGHDVRIDYLDEWGRRDLDIDVVIHIKGITRYYPKPYNINIIWIINHPSLHTTEELNQYDAVLVGSVPHSLKLQRELNVPVYVFHQATDYQHFSSASSQKQYDLVFVGNNKGTGRTDIRQTVADVMPTNYTLAVWGKGWEGLLPDGVLKGEFVAWEELPRIYSCARIVLNDHQQEMKSYGFINNRTYDAIASGALVISNYVQSMESVFPVSTYDNKTELGELIDYYLNNEKIYLEKLQSLQDLVKKSFSFVDRTNELLNIVGKTDNPATRRRIKEYKENAFDYRTVHRPLVSVLMSTYNRRHYLKSAINSVISQSYENWELVLVCDGGEPVDDIVSLYNDQRIRLINLPQRHGKGYAINRAFEASRGEFLAYLDDDDIYYENHLDTLLFYLHNIPGIDFVHSNTIKVTQEVQASGGNRQPLCTEKKREILYHHNVDIKILLSHNKVTWLSVMHRTHLFEKAGGLDERLTAFLDHDLWRRIACITPFYHINELTAEYYIRHNIDGVNDQITAMAQSNGPRYLANKVRIVSKSLPFPGNFDLEKKLKELQGQTKFDFLMARGDYFFSKADLCRSTRSYRLASLMDFLLAPQLRRLAMAFLAIGKPQNAFEAYCRCLESHDCLPDTDYVNAVLVFREIKNRGSALRAIVELNQSNKDDRLHFLSSKVYLLNEQLPLPSGSRFWEKYPLAKKQVRHDFLMARGDFFKNLKNAHRCQKAYQLAMRIGFDKVEACRQLGLAELELGNPINALQAFLLCLQMHKGIENIDYLNAALAYTDIGQGAKALECLNHIHSFTQRRDEFQKITTYVRNKASLLLAAKQKRIRN